MSGIDDEIKNDLADLFKSIFNNTLQKKELAGQKSVALLWRQVKAILIN